MKCSVCDLIACVYYHFDRRGRRRALENLRIIRGNTRGAEGTLAFDPDRARYDATRWEDLVIRGSYRNMTRAVAGLVLPCRGCVDAATREFVTSNERLVMVSGHCGHWESLPKFATRFGHPLVSAAKRVGRRLTTRLVTRVRESCGQKIVPAEGAFRRLMKGLKDGRSVGLLVDQPIDPAKYGAVWVRFLARPYPVSPAPALLAARSHVPILVVWARPMKDGAVRVECLAAYSSAQARDVRGTTQRIAGDFERIFRRHPSCCVLNYNYFSSACV